MKAQYRRIVVAVTTAFGEYQDPLFDGMRKVLEEHGVCLLAHGDDSTAPEIPPSLMHLLELPSTCGMIAMSTNSGRRDMLLTTLSVERALPIVHIGKDVANQACIRADNRQGMTALMGLILDDCGARTPVLVQGHAHQPDHALREEIFRKEIIRRGLSVDEDLIIEGRSDVEVSRRAMRSLLERRRDMDAVVCMNDRFAMVAIEALVEAGLQVPGDVVVTGFDNYPVAAISWPSVTTVDQRLEQQGAAAAQIILETMAGTARRERVLTTCELLPRASTATGRGEQACVPQTVEHVALVARSHVTGRAQLLRTGSILMKCRTLDDISRALPEGLSALGILRAFIVAYEVGPEEAPDVGGCTTEEARLVFDYRDGRSHPVPESTFSARQLLPDHLVDELHRGFLGFKVLLGSRRPLGYLVFERRFGVLPIVESLAMDVSRALEVILSANALMARSAVLEHVVMQRTQELMSEVTARRRIEQDLRVANAELERSIVLDNLTAIANRTALDLHFAEHWQSHIDNRSKIAVLMVDVDLFKAYNDHYGHLRGDVVLKTVASCLKQAACYPHDLVCRFGGEEFIAVLPFSGERNALTVATRFSQLLEEAAIPHAASRISPVVTASIGIAASTPEADMTPQDLIAAADKALYRAKTAGRNRIEFGRTR